MESRGNAAPGGEPESAGALRLREEIDFWAGMLEAADDSVPAESIERMTFALALAEFRLRTLCGPQGRGATVLAFVGKGGRNEC